MNGTDNISGTVRDSNLCRPARRRLSDEAQSRCFGGDSRAMADYNLVLSDLHDSTVFAVRTVRFVAFSSGMN